MATSKKLIIEDGKVFIMREMRKGATKTQNFVTPQQLFFIHKDKIKEGVQKRINACVEDLDSNGVIDVNDDAILYSNGIFNYSSYKDMLFIVEEWSGDLTELTISQLYQLLKSFIHTPYIPHGDMEIIQSFTLTRMDDLKSTMRDPEGVYVRGEQSRTVLRTTKVAVVNGNTVEIESR